MKKGVFLAIIYGIVLITAFYFRDFLLHWLHESDVSHLPFMFFLSILFGLIPMIPFTVFAGTMGAKYGILLGSIINWFGSVGAVVIIFVLVRYLSVNNLQQYANRFKRLNKFNEMIARNAFFSVFIARIIHIIPPMVVHIYSVLSSMSFKTFFLATAIGYIPSMFVYAYLGNQLFTSVQTFVLGLAIYLEFILVVLLFYRWWLRAKKKVAIK
ncbi:TVP38/TMEM64 family protein [Aneurinibacillus tyrosinisolvens]|uniref:TVP38/TMEM64 family protein n=1 Tax=Aneurinibacillus tyrosinisolvens TaxID=1443435 RepID=UPI00063FAF1A|nr:VTT domain-containing protein [Aneurinibacillus tyrosinisolvens]